MNKQKLKWYAVYVLCIMCVTISITKYCVGSNVTGTVVNKQFTPAHSEVRMTIWKPMPRKTGIIRCVPVTYCFPDVWEITVDDGENKNIVSVNKDTYNKINIGDKYAD